MTSEGKLSLAGEAGQDRINLIAALEFKFHRIEVDSSNGLIRLYYNIADETIITALKERLIEEKLVSTWVS